MSLTVNQLIALLAIDRGTFHNELKIGTQSADLRVLNREGLIQRCIPNASGATYLLSLRGTQLVELLKQAAGDFLQTSRSLTQQLTVQVDASALSPIIAELRQFSHAVHGGYEPEAPSGRGIVLANQNGDKAEIKEGALYLVAEAGVTLTHGEVDGQADGIKSISLDRVDPVVYGEEAQASDVAVTRAKADPGSRHLVLKAVSSHEVAVPIKSVRL